MALITAPSISAWLNLPATQGLILTLMSALVFWLSRQPGGLSAADLIASLEAPDVGIVIVDNQANIQAINPTLADLLGKPSSELIHHPIFEVIAEDDWTALTQTEEFSPANTVSASINTAAAGRRLLQYSASRHPTSGKRPRHFVLQVSDVTDEHLTAQALDNAGIQLRRMLGKGSDLVLFTDRKLIINYANDNARNALGSDSGDLVGQPIYRYISDSDQAAFMKSMQQFGQKNRNEVTLKNIQLADNDVTPASAHIVRLAMPEKPGYAVIFSVVERHLQALAESKSSHARFSQVFHGTPDAILLIRAEDTMVLDFNEGFSRLLGYSREEAIGTLETGPQFLGKYQRACGGY